MLEDINEFKSKNGNVTYSVKELLYGVNNKLDKIKEDMAVQKAENKAIKAILRYQWGAIVLLASAAIWIAKIILSKGGI